MRVADYRYEIKEEALRSLRSYVQDEGNEQCGVLTGSDIGGNGIRISKVSPSYATKNGRCKCELDIEKANEFVKKDYEASGRTRFYIGEWHTHPEAVPHPSQTDYDSIKRSFSKGELCVPLLVMAIVGTESVYFGVYNGEGIEEIEPNVVD